MIDTSNCQSAEEIVTRCQFKSTADWRGRTVQFCKETCYVITWHLFKIMFGSYHAGNLRCDLWTTYIAFPLSWGFPDQILYALFISAHLINASLTFICLLFHDSVTRNIAVSGWHACFDFGSSPGLNLCPDTGFSQFRHRDAGIVPYIRLRTFPFTFLPIHHSSYHSTLNISQINKSPKNICCGVQCMVFIVIIDLNIILVTCSKVDKFLQYSILIKYISINRK